MDLTHLSFESILELFGVVAIIGSGLKIILEATKPFKTIQNHMQEVDTKLDNDNKRFKEIEKGQKELKETVNAQSKLLIQIADHLIQGNDTDKLKSCRDDLMNKLLSK